MFDAGRAALVVDGICVVTKGFSGLERPENKIGAEIGDPNLRSQPRLPGSVVGEPSMVQPPRTNKITEVIGPR